MIISDLKLVNFRNTEQETYQFVNNINVISGDNGQGKTSILESIYLLAITKSFRSTADQHLLQHQKEYFEVIGNFKNKNENFTNLRCFFAHKEGKRFFVNNNQINKYSELIGTIPTVLLSLDNLDLTYGQPAHRRRFIDIVISQVSPNYLHALQQYRNNLLQRNRLLSLINNNEARKKDLYPWTEQIAVYGSAIMKARWLFIEYLNRNISGYYYQMSNKSDHIRVSYKSSSSLEPDEKNGDSDIKTFLFDILDNRIDKDIALENTAVGPHRDDIHFYKDGQLLKFYGSQGENKTFLIALKLLERDYLRERLGEMPIVLLDDIFGELDQKRLNHVVDFINGQGQSIITTTMKANMFVQAGVQSNYIELENGARIT